MRTRDVHARRRARDIERLTTFGTSKLPNRGIQQSNTLRTNDSSPRVLGSITLRSFQLHPTVYPYFQTREVRALTHSLTS